MDIGFSLAWEPDFPALVDLQKSNLATHIEKEAALTCPKRMATSLMQREAYIYTIHDGEEIIGDIVVREKSPGDFILGCVCIVPEYQGRGVGRKAMGFLEGAFMDAIHWSLTVSADNTRSIRFYEQQGFSITGSCVEQGVPTVTMEWSAAQRG